MMSSNINIVIPMAGAGSRFEKAGYKDPKPFIDVNGKPMIEVATDALNIPGATFTFIVQKSHAEKYKYKELLNAIRPNCNVVEIDGLTQGAVCTVLKAKDIINTDVPVLIANCDQYVEFDCKKFINDIYANNADGGILSFVKQENDTKWSYAATDNNSVVLQVAEKKKISDFATVGVYFWTNGKRFVSDAEEMIENNDRVNNEFYVCPVYNYSIKNGQKIINYLCDKMMGLGTPEDLQEFLKMVK